MDWDMSNINPSNKPISLIVIGKGVKGGGFN